MPEQVLNVEAPLLISIVMPSFNQGTYIDHAIQSVLRQEYPRVEFIVMDGGSSDGTVGVIKQYEPRLKYWVSRPDGGPADALTQGFGHSSGDILGVLNADDFYLPGCFARIARAFSADPAADVISANGYFATASGELGMPAFSDPWDLRKFRYGACVLVQQATFFRRAAFERAGGFKQTGSLCWDMELWADMARSGARFASIEAFVAAFRLHDASITGSADHRRRRRQDARVVMQQLAGRPESSLDRVLHYAYRAVKFSSHPGRTLRQRAFFLASLRRWSL